MNETLEYIEAYFEKGLNNAEIRVFEERCIHDEDFAREVAFYIMSREAIRDKLLEQKKQQWRGYDNDRTETSATIYNTEKRLTFRRLVPYLAAACLLVAVALVYFFKEVETPEKFANNYINENYEQLSQNMDASMDSLQQGIAAFNKKEYDKALPIFQNIYKAHQDNSDAKKYVGLVFLMRKDYNNALLHFDELAQKKGLFSNPGLFLKALTLLKRNGASDKDAAKRLLEKVVNEKLEHSKEAKELLKKW